MYSLNKIIESNFHSYCATWDCFVLKQLSIDNNDMTRAVINTVAALIGMIPEGLVLLTSTVLAVSVIRLSRYRVLIQQLYSVETLARIDTICLDKTGTLTDGLVEFVDFIKIENEANIDKIISAMASTLDSNNVTDALRKVFNLENNWKLKK